MEKLFRLAAVVWLVGVVLYMTVLAGVLYVAGHFVTKWW